MKTILIALPFYPIYSSRECQKGFPFWTRVKLSLTNCHYIDSYYKFNPDGTVQLRLQIRIDDFRKLQNIRNISNQAQSEKLAFETLNFYTYTTRVCKK